MEKALFRKGLNDDQYGQLLEDVWLTANNIRCSADNFICDWKAGIDEGPAQRIIDGWSKDVAQLEKLICRASIEFRERKQQESRT